MTTERCECDHVVEVARTEPPFFPHGSELMCCGACGLVMGQDYLIQMAHIGWHAWEDGARNGSRGLLPDAERRNRNPYPPDGAA